MINTKCKTMKEGGKCGYNWGNGDSHYGRFQYIWKWLWEKELGWEDFLYLFVFGIFLE